MEYGAEHSNVLRFLKESDFFQDYLSHVDYAFYILRKDADLSLVYGNDAFYRLIGCSRSDMTCLYGNRAAIFLDCKDLEESEPRMDPSAEGIGLEHRLRKRNGGSVWVHTERFLFHAAEEDFYLCVSFNIMQYKTSQSAFQSFQELVRLVLNQKGQDVFLIDRDCGKTHILSEHTIFSALADKEFSSKERFLQSLSETASLSSDSVRTFRNFIDENFCQNKQAFSELRLQLTDGRRLWTAVRLFPWNPASGEHSYLVGVLEDVTERKKALSHCKMESRFYHNLLAEKHICSHIDVTEDRILSIEGGWNFDYMDLPAETYSSLVRQFSDTQLHPDDQKRYLEVLNCQNLVDSFHNGIDRLGFRLRRIGENDQIIHTCINIYLTQAPLNDHILGLLCLDDMERQDLEPGSTAELPVTGNASDFDRLVSFHGDIAYLVDPDNYLLLCGNQAFYERIGRSKSDCTGLKCYEVMQSRDTPCPFCSKANWSGDHYYMWKNVNLFLEREFLIKNKLVSWYGKEVMLALAVDISDNKNIADSLGNDTPESNYILAGIERMSCEKTLRAAVESALEVIGNFFRATVVQFWQPDSRSDTFECRYSWHRLGFSIKAPDKEEKTVLTQWIFSQDWEHSVSIESPDRIAGSSYDMYRLMVQKQIQNQKWIQVKFFDAEPGYLLVQNSSMNFQNASFLGSFSPFISGEIKKHIVMENMAASNDYDSMTGLMSHSCYERYFNNYDADDFFSLGVISINMDNLNGINASLGFQTGDDYLVQMADILKEQCAGQHIYRLHGDEFLIVVENIEQKDTNDLFRQLKTRFSRDCKFTVSLGYAWDNIEKDLSQLANKATNAMQVSKSLFSNSNKIFKDADRHKHMQKLVESIEHGNFLIYLQPKYNFVLKKTIGAEALIRYYSEETGLISPARFIDTLEKNNFIRYIDLFVLDRVCSLLQDWHKRGYDLPLISLNFSRLTVLEDDTLYSVGQITDKYEVPPEYIEIEITESMSDLGKGTIYQVIQELSRAGYSIALDDFGIKYTNLSLLADTRIDTLKLDRSLTSELSSKETNQIILKNVISMCKELDIEVIAEGVERLSQESILRKLGCKTGQGYLYGKPMPVKDFEQYLQEF